ncbi:hypothetical protein Nepgr_025458 [Nepenthes gracilis]|uniref:Uncharacterized protein n=1 Tax=Nepenthes gracilis TaxID=150966 RepID=A0AAD3T558_NEPGR|nr:hypothetical protein Nepgr_025458 [Nepenthes gracilis]
MVADPRVDGAVPSSKAHRSRLKKAGRVGDKGGKVGLWAGFPLSQGRHGGGRASAASGISGLDSRSPPLPNLAEARPLNGGGDGGPLAGRVGDKGGKVGFVGRFSFESRKAGGPSLCGIGHLRAWTADPRPCPPP